MAISRAVLGLLSLIVLAGGCLLELLVILSSVANSTPLNKTYFLQADTAGTGATRNPTRWTFFYICGVVDGHNGNCGPAKAALPFDPPKNFGSTEGLPTQFIGTHKFYYLSRFMFAFFLIALFFAAIALFTGVLALCTRLGAYLSGMTTFIATFFMALAASLMTACFVIGRDDFRKNGQSAHLGKYAFGFTWAAVACFFLSTMLFCMGGSVGKKDANRSEKKSMFGRKRSTRSRGSFIDSESQQRVKEEYE